MKKILLTISIVFSVIFSSFSQNTFMMSYSDFEGDTWGDQVIVADDGFVISGICIKDDIHQLFLMKTNQVGNQTWLKYFDFAITDHGNWSSSDKDADGNIYLAFENSQTTNLVKFSPAGDILWSVKYPGTIYQVKYLDNGELIIAVSEGNSVNVKRLDPATGSLIVESVAITSSTPLMTTAMSLLSDNTIVLSVGNNDLGNPGPCILYYLPYTLTTIQSAELQYTESIVHRSTSVVDDELISVGHIAQYASTDNRSYVSKYDTTGTVEFARLITYPSRNARLTKHVINDNNQIVALGDYNEYSVPGMVLLRGMTLEGDSLWTSLLSLNEMAKGFDLEMTNDGGYVVTGRTFMDNKDVPFLIKTNTFGLLQPLATNELHKDVRVVVFPNPTIEKVLFEFPENSSGVIQITDLTGHICDEFQISGKIFEYNTSLLKPGIYLYKATLGEKCATGKFVKAN